ncbi:MAG: TonB family protein [Acidobacteriia bacterium]|nr:TonB family protein [Terriglobia bacterium]
MRPSAATSSTALHGGAVLGLIFLCQVHFDPPPPKPDRARLITPLVTPLRWVRSAGGGAKERLPASRGRLPPRASTRVFMPPTVHTVTDHPLLPVPQAIRIEDNAPAPDIVSSLIGNPFGVDGPPSGGPGGPGGIGAGGCCGVGNQDGSHVGGTAPRARISTAPVLLYKVEPEYSDEARQAKVQGVVVIMAEVDASGRLRKIMIVQPLGLGLDEKAAAAAERWRFRPAIADGRPVASSVTIEVSFRLL